MSKFVNHIELKKQIQNKIQSVESDPLDNTTKVQAVDKFTTLVFRKTHKCIFLLFVFVCAIFGIPMMCLNYMSSLGIVENISSIIKPNNSIPLMLLKFSSFSTIYYSETNAYIQEFILLALLIFSLALLLLVQTWLKYVPKNYKERIVRIQSYSLQITVRNHVRKKQISQFTEYLETYTAKCLKWKINQLSMIEGKTVDERFLLNLLKEISRKPATIQDAVILPLRTKKVAEQLLDLREEASNILLAVFTYPEVAEVALQWWQVKENSESIKAHIVDVFQAPSSRNLLFDKLQNRGYYKNKVSSATKFIYLAVLWQIIFFLLFSGSTYLSSMPSLIFSVDFEAANSVMFCYGMVALQALILFLHVKLFHQVFMPGYLLKSYVSIFTLEDQANKAMTFSIFLLMWDLFAVPFCAHFIVDLADLGFTFDKLKFIVENSVFGEFGISNVLIYYCGIKHFVVPGLKLLIRGLKKCFFKCQGRSQNSKQDQDFITYSSIFIEFTILFCWSVLCSPAIAVMVMFGAFFKLEEFCNIKEFKRTCLIALCGYMQRLANLIKYFLIVVGVIFMNSILDGYILAIKPEFMNPLIISSICSVFILVVCIFLQKVEPNAFQRPVYFFFETFPQDILSKRLYNPEQEEEFQKPRLAPLLDEMTKAIVQKIYVNQQILFTYNEELKQSKGLFSSQLPELNRQDSSKKIVEEMNTMSRSLEESLKNRLLKKPSNPFEISPSTKEEEGEYSGIIYEDKVQMGPKKFKNVFIPLLYIPPTQRHSQPPPQNKVLENKYVTQLQRQNTAGEPNQKAKVKRNYESYQMAENETNSWGDIMINADFDEDQKGKKKKEKNEKEKNVEEKMKQIRKERSEKEKEVAQELLKRKVKFTDLFDSDEESIKNLVKRKIKQSIPKLK